MSGLSNRTLLLNPPPAHLLTSVEKQKLFILRQYNALKPCPNCATEVNAFMAWDCTPDEVDVTKAGPESGECPQCQRGLKMLVPLTGGWFWGLIPITKEAKP